MVENAVWLWPRLVPGGVTAVTWQNVDFRSWKFICWRCCSSRGALFTISFSSEQFKSCLHILVILMMASSSATDSFASYCARKLSPSPNLTSPTDQDFLSCIGCKIWPRFLVRYFWISCLQNDLSATDRDFLAGILISFQPNSLFLSSRRILLLQTHCNCSSIGTYFSIHLFFFPIVLHICSPLDWIFLAK